MPPPHPSPRDSTDFLIEIGARATLDSEDAMCSVAFSTIDNHRGTGWIRNAGTGTDVSEGTFAYNSWNELMSGENAIKVHLEASILTIEFLVNDDVVGVYVGTAEVFGPDKEGTGKFDWQRQE